jgi:hypothetical protein
MRPELPQLTYVIRVAPRVMAGAPARGAGH